MNSFVIRWMGLSLIFLMSFEAPSFAYKDKANLSQVVKEVIQPLLVSPPKDMETCFSPDEPCDLKLVKFVETAQTSLDIAIFDINLDQLVHQVLVKSKKIPVRILVDKRQSKGTHSLVQTLIKAGAQVRYGRQKGIMHNKFVIVDGKAIETGSFNFTNHAYKANRENQIYLWNQSVVGRYQSQFEKIWSQGTPAS